MKLSKVLTLVMALTVTLTACGQGTNKKPGTAPTSYSDEQLKKDIGEMLLVGFRGTSIDANSAIVRDIKKYHVGGVIIFEYDLPSRKRPRNITSKKQLTKLCHDLQRVDTTETLLIGIDQEGGMITRLRPEYGFPKFASAKEMGTSNELVKSTARATSKELQQLGINLNFAPVVDVNVNPNCPIIGKLNRSFSNKPERVTECARIWIDESIRYGVLSCPKHFPGHGSSKTDTHLGVADVSTTWKPGELEPYKGLISNSNVKMIMTTHVFNSHFDSVWPATLSKATLTDTLRGALGFRGIIITDDLAMGAMVKNYSLDTMVVRTINAGANMLCLGNNGEVWEENQVEKVVDIIYKAVKAGLIKEETIRMSASKIRGTKKWLDKQNAQLTEKKEANQTTTPEKK